VELLELKVNMIVANLTPAALAEQRIEIFATLSRASRASACWSPS
jgi:hypothetical protein